MTIEPASNPMEKCQSIPTSNGTGLDMPSIIQIIASCLPGMVGYWDTHLCCQFANNAYQTWFGKTEEQMRGIRVQDLQGAELFAKNEPYMRLALAGQEQSFERKLTKSNGDIGWVWAKYIPHRIDDTVVGFIALVLDITDRKQAEMALLEKAQELEDYFANAVDLFCIANTDGFFLKVNAAWSRTLGYEQTELVGKRFLEFVHPDDVVATIDAVASLGKQVPVIDFVNRYRHKDGSWRWIEWRSQPQGGSIFAAARDVTERIQLESRLNDESARLESILNTVGDPIFVKDNDHRVVLANQAFYDMFRMDASTVLGSTLAEEVPEAERVHFLAVDRKVLDTGLPDMREETLTLGDSTKYIVTRKSRFLGSTGKSYLVGSIHDITERKRAEAALLASKIQLQSILAGIPIPLFVKDAQSRFLLMNKACEEQWGMRLDDLYGTDASAHFPQDQMTGFLAVDRKVFEDGRALDFEEPFWSAALGETRLGHTFKNPVYDENGKPLYLVCATLDVTERKLAEAGMQQALRDKDALLKEVHHRVKNNLQVITSLLRMEAGRSLVADTKEVLGYMRGRIRTMAQLHESLYRSGTFASVDLGAYLSQVATQAFKAQELHRDSVLLTLNLGSVKSGMDQAQAAGLLLNELISNCLKHGFPNGQAGEVSVELQPANDQAKPTNGRWCLRVWDTGVGLPSDFEDTRKITLGLQLVTDLSHQLGGTLVIDSVPGAGARFNLVFTVQAPAALVMPP